jgi:hypothetical protein
MPRHLTTMPRSVPSSFGATRLLSC